MLLRGSPVDAYLSKPGLTDTAEKGKPTFHFFYGIALQSIDGILVDQHWRVHNHLVLDMKPDNMYPSDHFGLMADLAISEHVSDD